MFLFYIAHDISVLFFHCYRIIIVITIIITILCKSVKFQALRLS